MYFRKILHSPWVAHCNSSKENLSLFNILSCTSDAKNGIHYLVQGYFKMYQTKFWLLPKQFYQPGQWHPKIHFRVFLQILTLNTLAFFFFTAGTFYSSMGLTIRKIQGSSLLTSLTHSDMGEESSISLIFPLACLSVSDGHDWRGHC